MLAKFLQLKHSDRLRAVGWLVLVVGLVAGVVFYVVTARNAEPVLDDASAPGYTRSMNHELGQMMGHFGLILNDWQNTLTSPIGRALMLAVGAALFAGALFRRAWVIDEEERNRG
jgi:hypothetical protein